jgi:hypothetical protein
MGLLDGLNLGGVLRGALGEVEAAALPAAVNAVLAKTQYHDLNGLVDATLKLLAQYLPDIVDKASPNGTLQSK